jgi:hypothetical protein
MAPPDLGRSVDPISTRVTDYAHPITPWPARIFRPSYGSGVEEEEYVWGFPGQMVPLCTPRAVGTEGPEGRGPTRFWQIS